MHPPSDHAPPLARSYLFVPGDRPERFDKAWASAADAIVIDLEDAVAPQHKDLARQTVAQWLHPQRRVWVRCNAADSPWFEADLSLSRHAGLSGFMLPKAEYIPFALRQACEGAGIGLIALVETAVGMAQAEALAADACVQRLAFGALDFQVDMGLGDDDIALLAFRSRLVLASRLAGKPSPIDGVTTDTRNADRLRRDTAHARSLGFGAKLCIHPSQVPVVHEVLAPSEAERVWARRIQEALAASAGAAVAVDGKMVDRPVQQRAQRVLAALAPQQRLRG